MKSSMPLPILQLQRLAHIWHVIPISKISVAWKPWYAVLHMSRILLIDPRPSAEVLL